MHLGTPSYRKTPWTPESHKYHRWEPCDNDVRTVKHCLCGATRAWNGRRWVVRKAKPGAGPKPS